MAESLRRLVNIGTFTVLQDKLERWLQDYYLNTCDQNVARGCEIVELNAKVQGQLFKLLSVCASEGGMYGGASIIKSRLLPWLGQNFFTSGGSVTADTSLSVLADAANKDRELTELQSLYEKSLDELEAELNNTKVENQDLRDELLDVKEELNRSSLMSSNNKTFLEIELSATRRKLTEKKIELDRTLRSSTSDKMFADVENRELRKKLAEAEEENKALRSKAGLLNDYQTEVRRLREDIALLTQRREVLQRSAVCKKDPQSLSYHKDIGLADAQDEVCKLRARAGLVDDYERKIRNLRDEMTFTSISPSIGKWDYLDGDITDTLKTYRFTPRLNSTLSIDDPVQRVRQQNLIARFNDMFAQDRLDALDTLRRYSDDHENNQRIIFVAISEAFSVAKLSFRQFKLKVRANLAKTHYGPDTLEEAVQDYINRNNDLYDLPGMVSDVIRAMNRNPKIFLPPDASFAVVQPFIREAVKLAWQMSSLAHPLDIAVSTDAELFDDNKYRRSYDSEYTAPLVNHHIWPCLMQGIRTVVKGEALTRRGASLNSPRRGRSPVRALSPYPRSRSISPFRRSRSPSPRRSMSPGPHSTTRRSAAPVSILKTSKACSRSVH